MTKKELEHHNTKLTMENEILRLKIERDEVYWQKELYVAQKRIEELSCMMEKGSGTHAIGFDVTNYVDKQDCNHLMGIETKSRTCMGCGEEMM